MLSPSFITLILTLQPVTPLELWDSPPFNLSLRDGYFYGRGVDDDKGGVLQAVQVNGRMQRDIFAAAHPTHSLSSP